jgi:alkylation response protein AidB-like acyl-CoA dehydrogenase
VLEELGAADAGAALALDRLGPALHPLLELGGAEALGDLGRPLLDAVGHRAVLVWNGAGARGHLERRDGGVHGHVPWVPADRVDLLVALDESGAFAVCDGIATTRLRGAGLRAAGASELRLEGAALRGEWSDTAAARRALARARLHAAALLVGVMRESAEFSRRYALDRVAFGRPIAHHQALAFLIADMATAVDGARMLLWDAAWRLDRGEDAAEPCATAFVEAAEQAVFVTPNGVQILGGHGFMQDYPLEKFMREARALGLLWGGIDAAREDAGRELAAEEGPVALGLAAS